MTCSTEEFRQALSQLLAVCKEYQAKALAQTTVLKAMLELAPSDRAAWNLEKVQQAIATTKLGIEPAIDLEAAALEQALANDTDFRLLLRSFVSSAKAKRDF
jgi:hypothetical protein